MKILATILAAALFACTAPGPTHQTVAAEFAYRLEAVSSSTDLEDEIAHSAGRIAAIATDWEANPAPTQSMADGMRSMAAYLEVTASLVESGLDPVPPSGGLDTQLDGKPLPGRPSVDLNAPRSDRYGATLNGATVDFDGRHFSAVTSSGLLLKEDCFVSNFLVFNSGGDAIKFDGGAVPGTIEVRGAHTFNLGKAPGAHADSFQTRGQLLGARFVDCYFDQPTNAGDGSRSNACIIMDSSQGANGLVEFEDCILRGGNFSIMLGDKGSGNYAGDIRFVRCAFIVEEDSPRYGLVAASSGTVHFGPSCGVYFLNKANGICELLTRDVSGFDFPAWHLETFGRETAR